MTQLCKLNQWQESPELRVTSPYHVARKDPGLARQEGWERVGAEGCV